MLSSTSNAKSVAKGHLARLLAYGYGMNVDAVEAEESHLGGAEKGERMLMTDWEKQEQRAESSTSSKQSYRKGSLTHTKLRVGNCVNVVV